VPVRHNLAPFEGGTFKMQITDLLEVARIVLHYLQDQLEEEYYRRFAGPPDPPISTKQADTALELALNCVLSVSSPDICPHLTSVCPILVISSSICALSHAGAGMSRSYCSFAAPATYSVLVSFRYTSSRVHETALSTYWVRRSAPLLSSAVLYYNNYYFSFGAPFPNIPKRFRNFAQ
jgi:hypothetical protein